MLLENIMKISKHELVLVTFKKIDKVITIYSKICLRFSLFSLKKRTRNGNCTLTYKKVPILYLMSNVNRYCQTATIAKTQFLSEFSYEYQIENKTYVNVKNGMLYRENAAMHF